MKTIRWKKVIATAAAATATAIQMTQLVTRAVVRQNAKIVGSLVAIKTSSSNYVIAS